MSSYLGAVWRCRFFWWSLVKIDLRTRYQRSMLGLGWSLVHPLAMTAVISIFFRHLLRNIDPSTFPVYLLTGLACWNFIVYVTIQGCRSLLQGESYIRQHPAPMVIYPLRTALGALIHFLIALVVVLGLSWVLMGMDNWIVLPALVPGVVLLFLLGWALAVLASFANVYFQDTQHLCEVGFQILFYATPIMYEPRMFGEGRLFRLLSLNPLVPFLEMFRAPIVRGQVAGAYDYGMAGLIVLLVGGMAAWTLAKLQKAVIFRL
jgi:ABC-type polysaccharide/polyol phosphate export permease